MSEVLGGIQVGNAVQRPANEPRLAPSAQSEWGAEFAEAGVVF